MSWDHPVRDEDRELIGHIMADFLKDLPKDPIIQEAVRETMEEKNLELWNRVCKTDPSHTKKVSKGNFTFTAIDAYYQIRCATEAFGPVGKGWWWEGKFELISLEDQGRMVAWVGEITTKATDAPIPCVGTAQLYGVRSGGKAFVDPDAFKKAMTDAITKGLSYLGFNADVFLGQFDDNKYVQERRAEEAAAARSEAPKTSETPKEDRQPQGRTEPPGPKHVSAVSAAPHEDPLNPRVPLNASYWIGHPGVSVPYADDTIDSSLPAPGYAWQSELVGVGNKEFQGKTISQHPWLFLLGGTTDGDRAAWLRFTINCLHCHVDPNSSKYHDFIARAKTTLAFIESDQGG